MNAHAKNLLPVISLCMAIIGLLLSPLIIGAGIALPAIITAHIARRRIRKQQDTPTGYQATTASLCIAYPALLISIVSASLLIFVILQLRSEYAPSHEQQRLIKEAARQTPDQFHDTIIQLLSDGHQSDAEKLCANMPARFRENHRILFLHAVLKRSRWNKTSAHQLFHQVVALAPDTNEAQCSRLMMDLDMGAYVDKNLPALQKLSEQDPDNILITWLFAMACRDEYKRTRNSRFSTKAIDAYEKLGNAFVMGPSLFHQTYANVLEEVNQYEKAYIHRKLAVELEPAAWTYHGLAHNLEERHRYGEAVEFYEKAVEVAPFDPDYRTSLSGGYTKMGEHDKSIAILEEAANIFPDSGRIYTQLGYALEEAKRREEATAAYKRAAELKNPFGTYKLGLAYCFGRGIPADPQKGIELLEWAAMMGTQHAYDHLGRIYAEGKIVERNPTRAVQWLEKGVQMGSTDCMYTLGQYYNNGKHRIPKNQTKGLALFEEGAARGHKWCAIEAGTSYFYKKGVPCDYDKAFAYYRLAESLGLQNDDIYERLGGCYRDGKGCTSDIPKALHYYTLAHEKGSEWAGHWMANAYRYGWHMEKNPEKALEWDIKTFEANIPDGMAQMAQRYIAGDGVEKNNGKAMVIIEQIVKTKNMDAINAMAWFFAIDPVHHNGEKAVELSLKLPTHNHDFMDTVAAAYARAGNYEKAISLQSELLERMRKKPPDNFKGFEDRLELYRRNEPYTRK